MNMLNNLIINIYSLTLLIIIYFQSSKHDKKEKLLHHYFTKILFITMLLLVVDTFSRFDGKPDTILYPAINQIGNFLVFLLCPILPSMWLLFIHNQIFKKGGKIKWVICPIVGINAILVVLSQFFGWFYYIDSENIYHRGQFFFIPAISTVILLLATFILIIVNREKIEKKNLFSFGFFMVPPIICIILQIVFYGLSLMLSGVVVSLMIVFLTIQNQSMYTDYLTGVYNRKKYEIYLKDKISTCTENKTFSAIMIDLNNFKAINDTFGHDVGDCALQTSVRLLNNCLRTNDFIARIGGDEFCIILDVSDMAGLEEIVNRIHNSIQAYNETRTQPYILGLSMGYAVYNYHSYMKTDEFQKEIDTLMYIDKQNNKNIKIDYSGLCNY